jgi:hypothetical protein
MITTQQLYLHSELCWKTIQKNTVCMGSYGGNLKAHSRTEFKRSVSIVHLFSLNEMWPNISYQHKTFPGLFCRQVHIYPTGSTYLCYALTVKYRSAIRFHYPEGAFGLTARGSFVSSSLRRRLYLVGFSFQYNAQFGYWTLHRQKKEPVFDTTPRYRCSLNKRHKQILINRSTPLLEIYGWTLFIFLS